MLDADLPAHTSDQGPIKFLLQVLQEAVEERYGLLEN